MPAAAVIPAPIAYIKVVAVKKLVVEPWAWLAGPPHRVHWSGRVFPSGEPHALHWVCRGTRTFTLKKIRVFKASILCLKNSAWDNEIGLRVYFRRFSDFCVRMVDRGGRGHSYPAVRGEILGFAGDELMRKRLSRTLSLIKNES